MTLSARLLFDTDAPALRGASPGVSAELASAPDEAERALLAERAWYWPDAEPALGAARGALRVVADPSLSARDALVALTRGASTLASELGASAVVSEPVGLAFSADAWREQALDVSSEDVPVLLWVAFEGREVEGARDLLTRGLAELGLPEVEIAQSARDGEHVLEVAMDLALVLLTSDTLPEDGETVEVSAGRVRVRRMPSLRGTGASTLRARV